MLWWFVGLLLVSTQSVSAQHIFVSSPNIVRVGNVETVLINVFNTDQVPAVTVKLKNGDGSEISQPQTHNVAQNHPVVVELFVDPANIPEMEGEDALQYVKLEVTCPDLSNFHEEKDLLVSYEEGFVFIQTDKPIYTPDQSVSIRLMILDKYLRPSDQTVQLDILTPQDVIVNRIPDIRGRNGFSTHIFRFPHEPLFGNWSVTASYGKELKTNRSVQFEVKEYVLPTFSVKLTPPDHILSGDQVMAFTVEAKYVYNKPVQGSFYAKVGILEFDGEIDIKRRMEGQLLGHGTGHFQVVTNDLGENWFEENKGKRLYVEVSVLETATGMAENVSDTSAMFVDSPYTFRWDRTIRYFKKGLPYEVKTDLSQTNGRPASDVPVEVTAECTKANDQKEELFGEEIADGVVAPTVEHTNNNGQVNFRIYIPSDCVSLNVTLKTKEVGLRREGPDGEAIDSNAKFNFVVEPEASAATDDFILIRLIDQASNIVTVDQVLHAEVMLRSDQPINGLTYYVVSRGTISSTVIDAEQRAGTAPLRVRITFDMSPSARIVAFYINQAGQVIADSLWIEITRTCANEVSVSVANHQGDDDPVLDPDMNVDIQVDALADSTVALLGVDKAVYLLRDFHRLTRDKMYKTMDTYDAGCGPGGGRDSPSIFKDAGIMVLSSASLDVGRRETHGCVTPLNPRRRRSTNEELVNQFSNYTASRDLRVQLACKRGLKLRGVGLTCVERRNNFQTLLNVRYPGLPDEEVDRLKVIFLECCVGSEAHREGESRGRSGGQGPLGDGAGIADYAEPAAIRSDFKETWIFEELQIPSGEQNSVTQTFTIPSSITEWSLSAVVLSPDYGMCVSSPYNIVVMKDFFIQLLMPYSVVRKEQIEIIVTVFNYRQEDREVTVFLRTTSAVCSEGDADEFSAEKTLTVNGNDASSVKYLLIGFEVGLHPIEVLARSGNIEDAVSKKLRVVPEGVERTHYYSTTIDPEGSLAQPINQQPQVRAGHSDFVAQEVDTGELQTQVNIFDIRRPSRAVPDSEKCEVSVIGTVLGPVVTAVIDGLGGILRLPRGCGEQTMIYLAPNVYVLRYLTTVDEAPENLVATAKHNIQQGIINQMTHRRPDGSFSVWGTRAQYPSSTWLTAFVNKVFCHASNIEGVFVDPKVSCQAMEWLIDTTQRADGAFYEIYRVHHREMTGGVAGEATLTAFVLISLLECECPTLIDRVNEAREGAIAFLNTQYENIDRPYAVAIVAYALALADSPNKRQAVDRLVSYETLDPVTGHIHYSADGSGIPDASKPYWYRVRPSAISVETTGYALLAMLVVGGAQYPTYPIVQWLTEQQNYGGGFASTQDTVIALQALAEYSSGHGGSEINMLCTLKFSSHGELDERLIEEFRLTKPDALVQRHATSPVGGTLVVRSVGSGSGKMNVKFTYNTISEDLNDRASPFEILINAREARASNPHEVLPEQPPRGDNPGRSRIGRLKRQVPGRDPDRGHLIVNVVVEVGYHKNEPTNMAIIDVGLYTGFKPIKEDLDEIKETNEYINRYEVSQRSVIFYADNIPPVGTDPPLRLEFNARREFIVGNLQPVAVKVYDYYNPSEEAVQFYHPTSDEGFANTLASICEGQKCVCAAGDCYDCGPNDKDILLDRSCESAQTYAYKIRILGRVADVNQEQGFKVYNVRIIQVLKAADDTEIVENTAREFWVSSSCNCDLIKLKKNSYYLVIGKTVLPYVNQRNEESFKYILDNNALVESWPQNWRIAAQFEKMEAFQADMLANRNNCQ